MGKKIEILLKAKDEASQKLLNFQKQAKSTGDTLRQLPDKFKSPLVTVLVRSVMGSTGSLARSTSSRPHWAKDSAHSAW